MSSAKEKLNLTVQDKEKCLNTVMRACGADFDSMEIQDALLRCDWDTEATIEQLSNIEINKNPNKRRYDNYSDDNSYSAPKSNGSSNGNSYHAKKKVRKNSGSGEEATKPSERVFDSDDDDSDGNDMLEVKMTKERKDVFEFINNATINELQSIKSCSLRKAEMIIETRPFTSWSDLVNKFQTVKPLQADLLNYCQEYLDRRSSLTSLMNKCKKIVTKLEAAVERGAGVVEQPALLSSGLKLSQYQIVGLNWLAVMHQNDMNGILADEMGLGKTIQIIAFLAYMKEKKLSKHVHLIVVPSSTLDNWSQELGKWCPELVVVKYYGSQEDRKIMRMQWAKNGFKGVDALLTTYNTISATGEEKKMFKVTPMHYAIFDEGHMLKNLGTARYQALIRVNAERRILLTGTPLQNNLLELMSLLCFIMPTLFGGKIEDIKSLFSKKGGPKLEDTQDGSSPFEQSQIERAKNIMKPFIMRRLKKDVLAFLPEKTEEMVKIKLTRDQNRKYQNLVNEYKSNAGTFQMSSDTSGSTIMMDMRKLANHPLLLRYYFSDDKVHEIARVLARDNVYKNNNAREVFQDIAWLSDFKLHQLQEKYPSVRSLVKLPNDLVCSSGKFERLDEMLPQLKANGNRVLIFSQFVMMLDVMEKYLNIRGHSFVRLDGSTAVTERQALIEEYTNDTDIFIFLLSTKAGGLGINLTAADTAIIHDIDFNPYNDKQAMDRVHRIGQTKKVKVYSFIAEGTIEEGMSMIANEKLRLEKEVTSNDGDDTKEEHKCMVRLLTMSLGLDAKKAEGLLSPTKDAKRMDDDF